MVIGPGSVATRSATGKRKQILHKLIPRKMNIRLYWWQICTTTQADDNVQEALFLNEEKVIPNCVWYLDNGASSHITSDKNAFTMLDNVWDWEIENNKDWEIDDVEMTITPVTFTAVYPTETGDPTHESNIQELESDPNPETPMLIPMQNQWLTLPTQDNAFNTDSEPQCYRRVEDIHDITDEVINVDESDICSDAKEPINMDDALTDVSWKDAMEEELKSICEN